MKQATSPNSRTSPLILTPRDEQMLRAIYQYRYMTSLDMAHLLFKPSYLSYVRGRLARLAGGKDLEHNSYLCRLSLPKHGAGNQLKVLALPEFP